jgi:hypothetical protein
MSSVAVVVVFATASGGTHAVVGSKMSATGAVVVCDVVGFAGTLDSAAITPNGAEVVTSGGTTGEEEAIVPKGADVDRGAIGVELMGAKYEVTIGDIDFGFRVGLLVNGGSTNGGPVLGA